MHTTMSEVGHCMQLSGQPRLSVDAAAVRRQGCSSGRTTGSRSLSLPTSTVSRMAPPVREELHPEPDGATAGTPVVRANMARLRFQRRPSGTEIPAIGGKGSGLLCCCFEWTTRGAGTGGREGA